jgi:hypothetical protein
MGVLTKTRPGIKIDIPVCRIGDKLYGERAGHVASLVNGTWQLTEAQEGEKLEVVLW